MSKFIVDIYASSQVTPDFGDCSHVEGVLALLNWNGSNYENFWTSQFRKFFGLENYLLQLEFDSPATRQVSHNQNLKSNRSHSRTFPQSRS